MNKINSIVNSIVLLLAIQYSGIHASQETISEPTLQIAEQEDEKKESAQDHQNYLDSELVRIANSHSLDQDTAVTQIQALLEAKANPNATNAGRDSALNKACLLGSLPVIKLLINNQANIHHPGEGGETPLHCAAQSTTRNEDKEFTSVIQLLVEQKANPHAEDQYGQTPFDIAVLSDTPEAVQVLTTHLNIDPNAKKLPFQGESPLQFSIQMGHDATAFMLLATGANPHIKDKSQRNNNLPWTERLFNILFPPTIFDGLTAEQKAIAESVQNIKNRAQGNQNWLPKQLQKSGIPAQYTPSDLAAIICDYCDVYTKDISHPLVEQFEKMLIKRQIRNNKKNQKQLRRQQRRNLARICCGLNF